MEGFFTAVPFPFWFWDGPASFSISVSSAAAMSAQWPGTYHPSVDPQNGAGYSAHPVWGLPTILSEMSRESARVLQVTL